MSRPRSSVKAVQHRHESSEEEDDEDEQRSPRRNMHSFGDSGMGSGVPAFLAKLWRLVDDTDTNHLICWTKDGHSFVIQNQAQFARELLPLNYKHNNMASFIRQLNMYGFHKITSIENGGLRFDRDEIEFSHPFFKRNSAYLLDQIKRKISNNKNVDDKAVMKPEAVSKILNDVKVMQGRQDTMDSRFSAMKQENEVLWREIASLRQKHSKQQQIVNKLIQFLISIVQPSRNMSGVKRHMQLMINDTPENVRARTTSETESDGGSGPVIHELSEELLDEVMNPSPVPYASSAHHDQESASPQSVERPQSINFDYSNQSVEDLLRTNNGGGSLLQLGAGGASPLASSMSHSPAEHIAYTVTELPDAHVQEVSSSPVYTDEHNVLTPLVREQQREEERQQRQQLKEKNKQRRQAGDQMLAANSISVEEASPKSVRTRSQLKTDSQSLVMPQPVYIKTEPETDSGLLDLMDGSDSDMYNVNFISEDMPSNIFEDSSMLSTGLGEANKLNQQQTFGKSTVSSGKFASNFDVPISSGSSLLDANQASTSRAAAATKASASSSASASATEGEAAAAMAVAKYAGENSAVREGSNNGPLMRINSVLVADKPLLVPRRAGYNPEAISPSYCCSDDVHGHLDNVQDELETLKDLLRGDGVSIDQNMLLGLFNDSELLDTYGLSFPTDSMSGEKKASSGSEIMTYQPSPYDLSDILDTDDNEKSQEPISRQSYQTQSSVLNTPRHDF
ncbi:heat shock factor protein isoform X2 [Drosophila subobscura]|uniref:heat shock factor protein isoform X2 n=1 Tax=Drosophila subobscura TaxID=7241 RepID=UPI00155AAC37|nr:heat shock factor protein isoform X2 [Drosophila subobscura]